MPIVLDKLIALMENDGFKDPQTGNLFFPAYIYVYAPEKEHEMNLQLKTLITRLERPNHFLLSLHINLYDLVIEYLKDLKIAGKSYFEHISEQESINPEKHKRLLYNAIDKDDFVVFFKNKLEAHFGEAPKERKVYLLINGVGEVYPYLRVSSFMKRIEQHVKNFKIITFYPGTYQSSNYNLFGKLNDDNIYRANSLNQMF